MTSRPAVQGSRFISIPGSREHSRMRTVTFLAFSIPLVACTTVPSGPSTLVLPGPDKNEVQFRSDDGSCRNFSHAQLARVAPPPHSQEEGQVQFDITYLQCMYARGHLIPVPGEVVSDTYAEAPDSNRSVTPAPAQGLMP